MGITGSLAFPDPAAASLGCNLPAAQLWWLPEVIAEVPLPTSWHSQLTLQRPGHSLHPSLGWSQLKVALLALFLVAKVPHGSLPISQCC